MSDRKWQPIATAPKDGRVLRLKRVYRRTVIAEGEGFYGSVTIGYGPLDGGPQRFDHVWVVAGEPHFFPEPTHWMPIPASPSPTPRR